ncbi:MAG: transglutaminase-like cysteine peptidase [Bradyrhizobium sp.]|jgi:predicted transglutaminase-like cysteine proteinase
MSALAGTLNLSALRHGGSFVAILAAAWAGLWLAGAVFTLEPPQLTTDSAPAMTFLAANAIEAVAFAEDGTNAATEPPARKDKQAAQLFGMETEPVATGELPEKWHHIETAMAQDFAVVAQCHANRTCPVAAQRLIDISAKGAGRSGRARVGLINRAADLAISPASDEMQWGVADHWSDPFETLLSNRGDCEDYAILKYAALLEAGIPKDDVKIIILKNLFPNETHAAVATRVDGQWLILDNRTLTLVRDTDVRRTIPVFVLDHEGVKRFNWASQNRRVGS